MSITLREIAELIGGRLEGDGGTSISGAAIIRDAQSGDITLADNIKHAPQLAASGASAAIVGLSFQPKGLPYIAVSDVHHAFAKVVTHLRRARSALRAGIAATAEIHPTAIVSPQAAIGENVKIGPRAIIDDYSIVAANTIVHGAVHVMTGCQIGESCELFPNVVLYENTVLHNRVTIHAGSVLGAYGFGYEQVDGAHRRSAQLGYVEIEEDVEIGACTTIDRGTYGATRIGTGTKIDNHVMIAHNCKIGRHNLICAHVGIAGSSSTGDYVVLAGQVGVRDHVHIGDRAVICAQAGVMNDVSPGSTLVGSPAIPEREQMIVFAASYKLPEMRKQFKALQRVVEKLGGSQDEIRASDSGIHSVSAIPLRESA